MAISRVTAHSAQASSVAITTPAAGDLILAWAHRDGSTTAPSLPSGGGYTNIANGSSGSGSTANSYRVGYKFSDGTETGSGTWTNATSVAVGIYRGVDPQIPIGGYANSGTTVANGGTMSYPALAAGAAAMQVTDNTSWVIGFGAGRTTTNVGTNAPSGLYTQSSATDIAIFDTNGTVTSWSAQTAVVAADSTAQYRTTTIELVADANPIVTQLVSHVMSQTNGNYETANTVLIPTANPTRSGNCLVLCLCHAYSAGRTVGITDDQSSSWPSAAVTRNNDAGTLTSRIYVLPNVAAGITMLTVEFDAAVYGVQYELTELWGIAQTSPVDDTSSAEATTPAVAAGILTTTQANDVVISWGVPSGWGNPIVGAVITAFRPMQGFRLMSADSSTDGSYGLGIASQIGVVAATGDINPTYRATVSPAETINTLAVALKTDATKGSQATGIRVVGIQKFRLAAGTAMKRTVPCWGNLQVLSQSQTPSQNSVTAVVDSSGTYTRLEDAGYPKAAYIVNTTGKSSNVIKITNSTNFLHAAFYDVAGAATDPYDTTAITSGGTVTGPAYVSNAPQITPTTSNGLIFGILNFYVGPPDGSDQPSGVIYDCAYHDGMTDLSTMDTGDGYSHYYNATTAQASFRWHETAVTTSGWMARAVAFKAPASAGAYTITASPGGSTGAGVAATLKSASIIVGTAGAATGAGVAATPRLGFPLAAAAQNVSAAGTEASLRASSVISASPGGATGAGVSAGVKMGFPLIATPGGAAASGVAASALSTSVLLGAAGDAAAAGIAASALSSSKIVGIAGSVAAAGVAATLQLNYGLSAGVGGAIAAGVAATLTYEGLGPANYTITGLPGDANADGAGVVATLLSTSRIIGSVGGASAAGVNASLRGDWRIAASLGDASAAGVAASLRSGSILVGAAGAASGAGVAADIVYVPVTVTDYVLTALAGNVVLAGALATVTWSGEQPARGQRPAGAPGPAGRRSKRKRYVIDGQPMVLSPAELEDALATLLKHPPKRIERAVKAQAKVDAREERAEAESDTAQRPVEVPAYTQAPIFDYLQRQSWVQEQSDVLAALHAAAMRVMAEDDEDDVFLINEIFRL